MKITHYPEILKENKSVFNELPSYVKKQIIEIFGENITENDLAKESTEENEDILEAFSDNLPTELIKRTISDCKKQNKNLLESLKYFISLIEKRTNTWEVEGNEKYTEEAIMTINILSNSRYDQSLFLGRGNAGHVFLAPGSGTHCIKYLHNPSRQSFNLDEEFSVLEEAYILSKTFEAMKIPQTHCMAKNIDGTKNFFTMEKISGLTLAQLVDFPSKRTMEYPNFNTQKLVEMLSNSNYREKLLRDLEKLHKAGIIHGDIHPRNIMLSAEGEICLIDFGNAVIPVNVSTQATYDNIENVKDLDIKTFTNSIEKTVTELRKQLTN